MTLRPVTNDAVRYFCRELREFNPAISRFFDYYQGNISRNSDPRHIRGHAAEFYVKEALKSISVGMPYDVTLPRLNGVKTRDYRFAEEDGFLLVYGHNSREHLGEIDLIAILDGLPTVFEVKMARRLSGRLVNWDVLKAVKQFYGTTPAYVLVTPIDAYEHPIAEGMIDELMDKGIQRAYLPITRQEFGDYVRERLVA